jgi:hypothetical protein
VLTAMLVVVSGIRADEPQKAEQLPLPREVPAELLPAPRMLPDQALPPGIPGPHMVPGPYAPPDPPPQFGHRSVWMLLEPNQFGVPANRVVNSPFGAYYLYNGAPYPAATTRPHFYRPYLVD